jgi:hypothetical protein
MKTKPSYCLTGLCFALSLLLSGCGGNTTKLDTTAFDKAFKTAPAEFQALAPKASKAFKDGKFEDGGNALAEIARKSGLTEEQKEAMRTLIITVQRIMAEDPDKSTFNAQRSIDTASSTLEGRTPSIGVAPSTLPNK